MLPISATTSQKILYNLHATAESGSGSNRNPPLGQNNRYRSEVHDNQYQQQSQQRLASAKEHLNTNSASPSSGGEETTNHQQQQQQHQGRLLFKRQEKNIGKPSKSFQQMVAKQRNVQHYSQSGTTDGANGSFQRGISASVGEAALLRSSQNLQPNQHLQNAISSPRSDENRFRKGREKQQMVSDLPTPNSQLSFNNRGEHHSKLGRNNYQSFEDLSAPIIAANHQQTRSMRRITGVGDQIVQSQFTNKLQTKQSRITRKLAERINSQQQLLLNDKDDQLSNCSSSRQQSRREGQNANLHHAEVKLTPTRTSIPVLSTKNNLLDNNDQNKDKESVKMVKRSLNVQQNPHHQDNSLSFERRSKMKPLEQHNANGSNQQDRNSQAFHQHSSSVLPSHRHRHLLSSINVNPTTNTEKSAQLLHYSSGPNDQPESVPVQHRSSVYNSAAAIAAPSGVLRGDVAQHQTQLSARQYGGNGGSFRHQARQLSSAQLQSLPQQQQQLPQQSNETTAATASSISHPPTGGSNIFVSKVHQKNQQFKFQFRRKSQQGNNFKLNRHQNVKQLHTAVTDHLDLNEAPGSNNQTHPTMISLAAQEVLPKEKQHKRINSQRESISMKQPNFQNHMMVQVQPTTSQQVVSCYIEDSTEARQFETRNYKEAQTTDAKAALRDKNSRNLYNKLLSSESPRLRGGPTQSKSKKYRASNAYGPTNVTTTNKVASANVSDGSDFTSMVNMSGRGRLHSVAIQPTSFSKRMSEHEKVITSSQNSGGNISGLTTFNPQKPPNTPLKQSMNQMQHLPSADENTTQKQPQRNVYESQKTMKRHMEEQDTSRERLTGPSDPNPSASRTKKRIGYQGVHQSSGTTSQEGSGQEYQANQSLPSIKSKKHQKSTHVKKTYSRNEDLKGQISKSSHKNGPQNPSNNIVTSYYEQNPSKKYQEGSECPPYIIRTSVKGLPAGTSGGEYISQSKKSTFEANLQSFSIYKTYEEDGTTSSAIGSASDVKDTVQNFNGGTSLHSANNIVSSAVGVNSLEPPAQILSKTSSMTKFQAYQSQLLKSGCGTNSSNSGLGIKDDEVRVYSDQQSAAEIHRLQMQIRQRELAYSSLKTQFEQLRAQVAKKRNSSQESNVLPRFDVNRGGGEGARAERDTTPADPTDDVRDLESAQQIQRKRAEVHGPTITSKPGIGSRSSLNDLRLSKQRSNSEANLQHLTVPLRPIHEASSGIESIKETKSVHQTPEHAQPESKLRQPTRFGKSKANKIVAGSAQLAQNPEKSAPQLVHLPVKKGNQLPSHSPARRESRLSTKRISQAAARVESSSDSKHKQLNSLQEAGPKVSTSRFSKQKAPQKQKGGTAQTHSATSLDKHTEGRHERQGSSFVSKLQRQAAVAPQKGTSFTVAATKSKAKAVQKSAQSSVEALSAVSQTNKLAIQNLKQVINSTSKKLVGKKRASNPLGASQTKPQTVAAASADEPQSIRNQSLLDVLENTIEDDRDEPLKPTAQASFGAVLPRAGGPDVANRFRCAGTQQDRVDTEPVQEAIQRQESIYKEETPSNEQSQNSSNHPQPMMNVPAANAAEESKEFRMTGTAFGANLVGQAKLVAPRQICQAPQQNQQQELNCFGVEIKPEPRSSLNVAEQSSAIFARQSDQSQQSAAFADPRFQAHQVGNNYESIQSRCETPIHPNQVVDGIKFMDVQDPTYHASAVFDQCQEDENPGSVSVHMNKSSEQIVSQDHTAARAGTPMLAMNSTGKEFYSKGKAAVQNKQPQPQAKASAFMAGQQTDTNQAAVQVQKSSIQILKQLQKKKQGFNANGVAQRKGQHPKVVISQNNPFFAKQGGKHSAASGATSNNQTKSSAEMHIGSASGFGVATPVTLHSNKPSGGEASFQAYNCSGQRNENSKECISFEGKQQVSNSSAKAQPHSISRAAHETSVVSHEMFYSPIALDGASASDREGSDKEDKAQDQAVEILPQGSKTRMAAAERRRSDGPAQQVRAPETSPFQASLIEHAKRDDILDDSLLFALQDEPKRISHLEDEEGNADIEVADQHFYAQQMALQPEIVFTPTTPSEQEYVERSNLADLIASTGAKSLAGDGLLVAEQMSNPSEEMAALDSRRDAAPGLKKKQLDHDHPQPFLPHGTADINIRDDFIQGGFSLTDQKGASMASAAIKTPMMGSKGNAGLSSHGPGGAMINSGSKFTLTDMVQSNAALTYSESSPEKSGGMATLSEWNNQVPASKDKATVQSNQQNNITLHELRKE